jgi:hypothetical protein
MEVHAIEDHERRQSTAEAYVEAADRSSLVLVGAVRHPDIWRQRHSDVGVQVLRQRHVEGLPRGRTDAIRAGSRHDSGTPRRLVQKPYIRERRKAFGLGVVLDPDRDTPGELTGQRCPQRGAIDLALDRSETEGESPASSSDPTDRSPLAGSKRSGRHGRSGLLAARGFAVMVLVILDPSHVLGEVFRRHAGRQHQFIWCVSRPIAKQPVEA